MVAVPQSKTGVSDGVVSDRAATDTAASDSVASRAGPPPRERPGRPWLAPLSVGLALAVVALEAVIGVAICVHAGPIAKLPVATLVVAIGVGLLVAIDHWIRPRRTADGMLRLRSFMATWALLPFVIGLLTSAWLQHRSWQSGLGDVRELASEMNADPDLRAGGAITSDSVERTVHHAIVHHFPGRGAFAKAASDQTESPAVARKSDSADGDDRADEERRFIELARVVGHDLLRANDRCAPAPCAANKLVDSVARGAHADTRSYVVMAFAMQALFVLWIPFLLVVSIARAASRLDGVKPARGLDRNQRARRCVLDEARDVRILGEDHAFFAPRLCFAALLLLGTTYVFAPFGLKTSYTMSLVEAHALPGHTSFMLWCNHFSAAPVLTVGFVGFLVYALITATQRFAQDDFDDVAMFSLLIRGLTVILLSLALSSAESSLGELSPRLVVFLAGVFPVRALAALAKRANMSIDPEFEPDDARSFVATAG